jgi:hypothetical protein
VNARPTPALIVPLEVSALRESGPHLVRPARNTVRVADNLEIMHAGPPSDIAPGTIVPLESAPTDSGPRLVRPAENTFRLEIMFK